MSDKGSKQAPSSGRQVFGSTPGAGDWKRVARTVALVVLVVYAVLFFLWNRDDVPVNVVVSTVTMPLVWALLMSFALGAAVTYLLSFLRRRSVRKARSS